ncbi:MAG: RraA family protein [Acidobacteriia bacterium]|nr:RraA family protein [Terriglobia bacterium]
MTDLERPSKALIESYRHFPAAVLSDAMGRTNCMDSGIKTLVPNLRICGPAFTAQCYPGDNLMCHYGLHLAQAGDVLVIDGAGYNEGALWGGLLSLSASQQKLGGTVIEGAARDVEDLKEIDYPVYARNVTPRGVFKLRQGQVNLPVVCGGIVVHPGDLVVGDDNGIAVVPREKITTVIQVASEVLSREKAMTEGIKSGKTTYQFLGLERLFKDQDS